MCCSRCKFQNKSNLEYPCLECTNNRATDNFQPMTNADRIRNMSDEELCQFIRCARCDALYGSECEQQPYCKGMLGERCTSVGRMDKGLFKWLKAEVKEGVADE